MTQMALPDPPLQFDGSDYLRSRDDLRLTGQIQRVFEVMRDGQWHTLPEICARAHAPEASVSAQLRHLRKERFGAFIIEKRLVEGQSGLWEYRMLEPVQS